MQAGNWPEAEGFFLRAKQPETVLAMYRKARMWSEALRIAEDYLPDKVGCMLVLPACLPALPTCLLY